MAANTTRNIIQSLGLAAGIALGLAACSGFDAEDAEAEPEIKAPTEIKMNMPAGLQDCKTFRVHGERGYQFLVTRCPRSDTTTANGKLRVTVAEEVDEEAAREEAIAEMSASIEAARAEAK